MQSMISMLQATTDIPTWKEVSVVVVMISTLIMMFIMLIDFFKGRRK